MSQASGFINQQNFASLLLEKMKQISPAVDDLEPYEFNYALKNLCPEEGWGSVALASPAEIESWTLDRNFYQAIQTKQKIGGKIILDPAIVRLTRTLFVGLVSGDYSPDWARAHFFFDVRGFLFFCQVNYFSQESLNHFGGAPYRHFEQKQKRFEYFQGVGYKDFMQANAEIDQAFIDTVIKLIQIRGTPILLTLAGPTAAGKTEIIERLLHAFAQIGKKITTIEMDNFLMDRDFRGEQPMGEGTHHFQLFKQCLETILNGKRISIPRYDFVEATSSHDPHGQLKPGCTSIEVEPADIIFIEGNFPFQMAEIADLIGIKVVYLTADSVRLKRKWKRDIDYRKKYDSNFFINRYFKTQFLRAADCYLPQMEVCDLVVDTTGAALWVTPAIAAILD